MCTQLLTKVAGLTCLHNEVLVITACLHFNRVLFCGFKFKYEEPSCQNNGYPIILCTHTEND